MHSFYLYLYCQILVVVFVPTRVHRILYETARQIFHVVSREEKHPEGALSLVIIEGTHLRILEHDKANTSLFC